MYVWPVTLEMAQLASSHGMMVWYRLSYSSTWWDTIPPLHVPYVPSDFSMKAVDQLLTDQEQFIADWKPISVEPRVGRNLVSIERGMNDLLQLKSGCISKFSPVNSSLYSIAAHISWLWSTVAPSLFSRRCSCHLQS